MNKKFIGAGMSRKSYKIDEKICLKIPIEGREEAGAQQNYNEFRNINLAESIGLKCFPKVISATKDFMKLKVELCKPVTNDDWKELFGSEFEECGCNCGIGKSYAEYFGFGIVTYFKEVLRKINFSNVDDLIIAFKNGKDFSNSIGTFNSTYNNSIYLGKSANCFLKKIFTSDDVKFRSFKDIFSFYIKYPENIVLEDLWNNSQWGKIRERNSYRFVILDAGFDNAIQKSKHYRGWNIININAVVKTNPGDGMTFNGTSVTDIFDPTLSKIDYKFFTSKNSEYILSSNNMSRRIKQAGLRDDGLWDWSDKTIFVSLDNLKTIMKEINDIMATLTPVRVKTDWKNKIEFQKIDEIGEWKTFLAEEDFSMVPVIGMHTLEFILDGDIIRRYHPGHDVSWIENDHTEIQKLAS